MNKNCLLDEYVKFFFTRYYKSPLTFYSQGLIVIFQRKILQDASRLTYGKIVLFIVIH